MNKREKIKEKDGRTLMMTYTSSDECAVREEKKEGRLEKDE